MIVYQNMIPQLDLSNFVLTGIFITIYFIVFMQMIKIVFIKPINKYIMAYKEQLNINKLQHAMYIRQKAILMEQIQNRQNNLIVLVENKQREIMVDFTLQINNHEKFLIKNKNKVLQELEEEYTKIYTKNTVMEYINTMGGK